MTKMLELLERRDLFAAYGVGGVAVLRFRVANDTEAVAVQQLVTDSTGRAYVVATTKTTFQVQRLTAAGVLDTGFGKKGSLLFVRTNNAGGAAEVRVDSADRLVVLQDDRIVRLNIAGSSDTTFAGGSGVLKLGDFKSVADFAVDANNKIYVTGSAEIGTKNINTQMRIERFISRGKVDRSFDGDGVYDLPFYKAAAGSRSGSSTGQFIRVLGDGSFVAAGTERQGSTGAPGVYTSTAVRAVKFSATGIVDSAYGDAGVGTYFKKKNDAETSFSVKIQGIRATGQTSLLLSSSTAGDPVGPNSFPDQFHLNGRGLSELSSNVPYSVAEFDTSIDGKDLLISGDLSVAVLNASGTVLSTFNGGQPLAVTYAQSLGNRGAAADDARDGNIIVAGMSRNGVRVTIAKRSLTGALVSA